VQLATASLVPSALGLFGPPADCYGLNVFSGHDNAPPRDSGSDDAGLIKRVADGDRAALGTLYDRFAPAMLAVGQRILGGPREAEDLVHDVFLEAWLRARYYDPARGSVRTWLMLRLRSRALDRRRSAQRSRSVDVDDFKLEAKPTDGGPGAGSDARRVRGLMAELPAEQQAVLELSYFQGCTCAEIAVTLDIPIGTVKSRMSRAIAQLRASLGQTQQGTPEGGS
jgi:RNA polymerase sigma-70 factor (ECF subfamily)